jgi:two-component system, chemotaxis family, chemotaxis protein CheY
MANFLIVDDSAIVRKTIKKHLLQLDQTVLFEAQDGQVALDIFQQNKQDIDIVTLDISMPIINGLDTLKEMIKIEQSVVVYMITSHGEEAMVMDAIELGATGYILKPITIEKLAQITQKEKK